LSRIVGHLDLDYFYAQVEELEDPALKSKPVLVCVYSGRTEESGVVSTSNYKAREHGVRSGMPIALAKRALAGVDSAFIPMVHSKYELYSDRVMETLRSKVDVLEQTGIDEAFFDVTKLTGGDYGKASALAREIKREILSDEGLTCSIGIGPNKVVAKIASAFNKPDGLTVVREGDVAGFLSEMPADRIYGVGPKTAKILEEKGITTIAGLSKATADSLSSALGRRLAVYLHNAAQGIDDDPVVDRAEATQLSRMITLKHDTNDVEQITRELSPAVRDLQEKLAAKNLFFRNVSAIGISTDLSLHTKSKTLEAPTNDLGVLETEVEELFEALLLEVGDLRRAGVRASDLKDMQDQSSLTEFTG